MADGLGTKEKVNYQSNQHFLLFPQCFVPFPKQIPDFESFILSSANALSLDKSKIVLFSKEFNIFFCFWIDITSASVKVGKDHPTKLQPYPRDSFSVLFVAQYLAKKIPVSSGLFKFGIFMVAKKIIVKDCSKVQINPLPDDKILDRSKLRQSADDSFKFDENSRKFSKQVENTLGKGEIAHYEQFLLSHCVFKRLVSQGRQKVSLCGNGLIKKYLTCYIN